MLPNKYVKYFIWQIFMRIRKFCITINYAMSYNKTKIMIYKQKYIIIFVDNLSFNNFTVLSMDKIEAIENLCFRFEIWKKI